MRVQFGASILHNSRNNLQITLSKSLQRFSPFYTLSCSSSKRPPESPQPMARILFLGVKQNDILLTTAKVFCTRRDKRLSYTCTIFFCTTKPQAPARCCRVPCAGNVKARCRPCRAANAWRCRHRQVRCKLGKWRFR